MQPDSSRTKKFLAMLEFDLTKAQKNAFSEIQADMNKIRLENWRDDLNK